MNHRSLPAVLIVLLHTFVANAADRYLFKPDTDAPLSAWQSVNDGVMGGRSVGRYRFTEGKSLEFFGNLSLANNGGFASVRTMGSPLGLTAEDILVARVRGDGREYRFNLYTQNERQNISYRQSFKTTPDTWIEVKLPVKQFVATWRGETLPNRPLDPNQVSGLGILLGDKKAGPFKLEIAWIKAVSAGQELQASRVACEGTYPQHLQGICTDGESIYWSFTTSLVKTDLRGQLQKKIAVANHHGDLCFADGKLYVAVNLGKFNDPAGNADSWVYVYDADSLEELAQHATQEVFHGAGGIGHRSGHFFVVGGLPENVDVNYVYEYDGNFKFQQKHVIASGHTLMGIQTATFAHDRWWFGCYGEPKSLLVTDPNFQLLGRYEFDCSLGIEGLPDGRLLAAAGRCEAANGCTGNVSIVIPDAIAGLKFLSNTP